MSARVVALAIFVLLLWALLHASVTVPALTFVGLVLWALAASAMAVVLYRRGRTS